MRGEDFALKVFASEGEGKSNRHGRAIVQSLNVELTHPLGRTEAGTIISCHRIEQPRSFFRVRGEPSDRVDGISLSLLVRREFAGHRALQPYVDFSSGPMWTERQVPAATSRLNFLTQAGAGVVLAREAFPLFFGVRVAHISNAGLADHNPGWNVLSLAIGVAPRLSAPPSPRISISSPVDSTAPESYLVGAAPMIMQNATRSSASAQATTVTIFVPGLLRHCCGGAPELSMAAMSVRAAFEQLERRYPSLYRCVCDETGAQRRHVNIFVNAFNTRDGSGLDTELLAGDVITILPAVSGG